MHTKQIGDIAEMAVILQALKKGWSVSKPLGENQRYDLILDGGTGLMRVQCKSAKLNADIVSASLSRMTKNKNVYKRKNYTESEIDAFALYCHDNDTCYLINISDISQNGMTQGNINLRVKTSSANNQHRTRLAEDYIF